MTNEFNGTEKFLMCLGFLAHYAETIPRTAKHIAFLELLSHRIFSKYTSITKDEARLIQEKLNNFSVNNEIGELVNELDYELNQNTGSNPAMTRDSV